MNDRIRMIVKHPAFIPSVASAVSFAVGVGVGYFFWHQEETVIVNNVDNGPENDAQQQFDFEEAAELAEARKLLEEAADTPISSIDAEEYQRISASYSEESEMPEDEDVVEATELTEAFRVFSGNSEGWDYTIEMALRTPDAPYVVHRDEYFSDTNGLECISLTYYEGDNILVTDDNRPIDNYLDVVGELKFGHGSNDPNVVYIRNEKRNGQYEVLRHPGHFAVEVMGYEVEAHYAEKDLKHSNEPRRFREP